MVVGNPHGTTSSSPPGTTYGPAGMGFAPPKPKPIVDTKAQQERNENTGNQGITTLSPASTPQMQTGFGSFFGASSGSTASSPLVQETLKKIDLFSFIFLINVKNVRQPKL